MLPCLKATFDASTTNKNGGAPGIGSTGWIDGAGGGGGGAGAGGAGRCAGRDQGRRASGARPGSGSTGDRRPSGCAAGDRGRVQGRRASVVDAGAWNAAGGAGTAAARCALAAACNKSLSPRSRGAGS